MICYSLCEYCVILFLKSNKLQHSCSLYFIYTALAAACAEQAYNYQNDNKTPYIVLIKEVTETIHYNKLPSNKARIKPVCDFTTRAFFNAKRCYVTASVIILCVSKYFVHKHSCNNL